MTLLSCNSLSWTRKSKVHHQRGRTMWDGILSISREHASSSEKCTSSPSFIHNSLEDTISFGCPYDYTSSGYSALLSVSLSSLLSLSLSLSLSSLLSAFSIFLASLLRTLQELYKVLCLNPFLPKSKSITEGEALIVIPSQPFHSLFCLQQHLLLSLSSSSSFLSLSCFLLQD